ncbi:MAG TPA: EF-hand domain-containing protein [Vicinamibacterales bacterium]|nr:EF-hand domain-containing protein [Vicinamibacterales bacterium]
MRYGFAALLMLISSVVTAPAQGVSAPQLVPPAGPPSTFAPLPTFAPVPNTFKVGSATPEAQVSPDAVIARLMLFDRNGDGRIAAGELSERMQALVGRGDKSGDGTLDASEIRMLMQAPMPVRVLFRGNQIGSYGFGDTTGTLSTRKHIENTIEDLKLASQANEEARRIGSLFADEIEGAALANLRRTLAPIFTENEIAEVETKVTHDGVVARTVRLAVAKDGTNTVVLLPAMSFKVQAENMRTMSAAVDAYKADTQLDDARRAELAHRLSDVLNDEESENFSAALARRPLVKSTGFNFAVGTVGGVVQQLRNAQPQPAVVREIGLVTAPTAP